MTTTKTQSKKVFYHGTNADNLPFILKHGISCNESKLWNVSEDLVYLWSAEEVGKANECENEEEANNWAFRMAFESAQFACGVSKDCRAVVIKIELDEEEVESDLSSENMEGMGAVSINRKIDVSEIVEIKISNDLSLLKGYFLTLAAQNEFSNIELSHMEQRIVKALKNAEIYPDDIEDMTEWKQVKIKFKKMKVA